MCRQLGLHLVCAFILGAIISAPSFAEPNESALLDFNPSKPQPNPQDKNRKDNADDAKDKGNDVKPIIGNALNHAKNAADALKKADQLQQTDPAQAEQERKKAALEQQMANQLQQQAKENKKSADENKKAEEAVTSQEEVKGKKIGGLEKVSTKVDENKVIMVDDERNSSQLAAKPVTFDKDIPDPVKKELATFEDYIPPKKTEPEASPTIAPEVAAASDKGSFLKPEWESALSNQPGGASGISTERGLVSEPQQGAQATAESASSAPLASSGGSLFGASLGGSVPTILGGKTDGKDNGLDKDFFKDKDPKGKKKKKPARALASRWKGTKVRRVEPELDKTTPVELMPAQPDVPLPKSGKPSD